MLRKALAQPHAQPPSCCGHMGRSQGSHVVRTRYGGTTLLWAGRAWALRLARCVPTGTAETQRGSCWPVGRELTAPSRGVASSGAALAHALGKVRRVPRSLRNEACVRLGPRGHGRRVNPLVRPAASGRKRRIGSRRSMPRGGNSRRHPWTDPSRWRALGTAYRRAGGWAVRAGQFTRRAVNCVALGSGITAQEPSGRNCGCVALASALDTSSHRCARLTEQLIRRIRGPRRAE